MSTRQPPPPIVDDNPPTPPRQAPPAPSAVQPAPKKFGASILDAVAGEWEGDDTARVVAGLVNMRRRKPVEPMSDYVADGTRMLRFISDALRHEAALRGVTCQQILRDALLGVRPLSPELLDAHYVDLYGEPRP